MPERLVYGERLVIGTPSTGRNTTMPRTYSAEYVRNLEDLLVRASASYTRMYDKWKAADTELRAMKKATEAPVLVFQTFDPPDTGRLVVEERKRRGLM